KELIQSQLQQAQAAGTNAPRPILEGTGSLHASDYVNSALGSTTGGYVHDKTQDVAQANVSVSIATSPQTPQDVAYQLEAPLSDQFGRPGQQREPFSYSDSFTIPDL